MPRERFAGPGPWRCCTMAMATGRTPDADPRWLYHNVLVALDEKRAAQYRRAVSVGPPFRPDRRHGRRARAADRRRLGLLHGDPGRAGGADGHVDGSRSTRLWPQRRERNLEAWPTAQVRCADASLPIEGQWDVIVAFAGATAPRCLVARRAGRRRPPAAADDGASSAAASCCGSIATARLRGALGRLGRLLSLRRRAQRCRTRRRSARRSTIMPGSRPCAACAATRTTQDEICWLHRRRLVPQSKRELH